MYPGTNRANEITDGVVFRVGILWDKWLLCKLKVIRGDHSARDEPPVDFKTKVSLWPGQARAGEAKAELLS